MLLIWKHLEATSSPVMRRSRPESVVDVTDRQQQVFLLQPSAHRSSRHETKSFPLPPYYCDLSQTSCRGENTANTSKSNLVCLPSFWHRSFLAVFKTAFCCRQVLKSFILSVNHTFYGGFSVSESSCCPE